MDIEIKKDGEFEYLDEGQGPVIIVLHGLFGALSNFREVLDYFGPSYRIVIPIMPIYTMPIINTNIKNLARYIESFIDYMGFDKVLMLGNSLGGHVGLIYSTMRQEKLKALILTGSSGLYENAFGSSYPRKNDYDYIRNRVAFTFYDPKTATKELVDEVFGLLSDKSKLIRSIAIAKSAIRHNMAQELPNIKIPVCLIWGRNDNITPPEVAEEFHEKLPDSDLYWIDLCGHAPMMERPEEFNRILAHWLAKRHF
ncbi:MAG: alpha/beta hydrolase [Flavobacteriales bacterium]|nr:alpha/beta hydrolase [Flavobacteriales bacterium]MCZ2444175.1 alpha/beta hydrolase [Flavobacteriales bacterium]